MRAKEEQLVFECMRPRIRPSYCRERLRTVIEGESMTQQSHAESVDVNYIVERFDRTGMLPPGRGTPVYADVSELQVDLTQALNQADQTISKARAFAEQWKPAEPAVEVSKGVPPVAE